MVKIIIPCSNCMPYLKYAVESIINSTNFEKILLIESESTDGTSEYCESIKSDKIEVFHIKREGLVKAINFGIKQADSDVYLTQADTIHFKLLGRDWLKEMEEIAKNENVGLVTSLRGYGVSGELYINGLTWVGTWSCYIPKRTIELVGYYDENMGPGDDIDYSYRVQLNNLSIIVSDFWVQHHRYTEHGNVDSSEKIKKMAEYFRSKYKIGEK